MIIKLSDFISCLSIVVGMGTFFTGIILLVNGYFPVGMKMPLTYLFMTLGGGLGALGFGILGVFIPEKYIVYKSRILDDISDKESRT
jgi:hypothetical protein